ncbi:MAG: hypothetical protein AAFQ68_06545, partial [Bacteroidota bacterium]
MRYTRYHSLIFIGLLLGLSACKEAAESKPDTPPVETGSIMISASAFAEQSGDFSVSGEGEAAVAMAPATGGWLTFEIDVPEAGRYRTEVVAQSTGDSLTTLWVEDHIDNTDGRTYNITSSLPLAADATDFQTLSKEGSPLNAGKHMIKLHVGSGVKAVKSVSFELMVKHQLTPKVMTQSMEGDDWEVVWSDEFEGNGMPDTTKWTYDIGNWGWGNSEPQYYTKARSENARIEDGNL